MENINVNELIDMLIVQPKNEFEVGFNSALIKILKKQVEPTETEEDIRLRFSFDNLNKRGVINFNNYDTLTRNQKDEVYKSIVTGNRLMSVKQLKEFYGLGLKEVKDIVDLFVEQMNKL